MLKFKIVIWIYKIWNFVAGILRAVKRVLKEFWEAITIFWPFLLAFIVVIILGTLLDIKCEPDATSVMPPRKIYDSTLQRRQDIKTSKDTVINFAAKLAYTEKKPEIIYYSRIDSNRIKENFKKDLITNIDMDGSGLKVMAFNASDSTMKEYIYSDIGKHFTITAQNGKLFVKVQKFWWNGIDVIGEYQLYDFKTLKQFEKKFNLGIETSFNLGTKFQTGITPMYDFKNNDFSIRLIGKIKIAE